MCICVCQLIGGFPLSCFFLQVLPCEGTDGKLIVKEGGSFAVLFADRFSFCRGNSSDDCYSHSLSKVG